MKKKKLSEKMQRLLAAKGFYIALLVCIAAAGIALWATGSLAGVFQTPAPVINPTQDVFNPHTPAPTAAPGATHTPAPTFTPTPTAAPAQWVWPVAGAIELPFSIDALIYNPTMADWRTHAGVDIAADVGSSVGALTSGTVSAVEKGGPLGVTVKIDHGGGLASVYANLAEEPCVKAGDRVEAGHKIGVIGDTAIAESGCAPHLHLEVTLLGKNVDPAKYLP